MITDSMVFFMPSLTNFIVEYTTLGCTFVYITLVVVKVPDQSQSTSTSMLFIYTHFTNLVSHLTVEYDTLRSCTFVHYTEQPKSRVCYIELPYICAYYGRPPYIFICYTGYGTKYSRVFEDYTDIQ